MGLVPSEHEVYLLVEGELAAPRTLRKLRVLGDVLFVELGYGFEFSLDNLGLIELFDGTSNQEFDELKPNQVFGWNISSFLTSVDSDEHSI